MSNVSPGDIKLEGKPYSEIAGERLRAAGLMLIKEWKERGAISLPVFETELSYFSRNAFPDEIWLFASDHPETASEKIRQSDTITLAVAIKRLIIEKYGLGEMRVKIIGHDSCPESYDEMLDFFDRFFRKMKGAEDYADSLYFVSMTTGSVAANLGMIISAASYFGNNCEAIYLSGGAPRRTEMVGKLMDKRYFQVAQTLLLHYDYSGLHDLVKDWNAAAGHILLIISACQKLYDFNFGQAAETLDEVIEKKSVNASSNLVLRQLAAEIKKLEAAQKAMIRHQSLPSADKKAPLADDDKKELFESYRILMSLWYHKIRISWCKENYFEFYNLLFGLVENMSKFVIMQFIGIPVLKAYFTDVKHALRSFEGFGEYAEAKGVNFNYEVNNLMFDMFLKYLLEKGYLKERGRVISGFLNPVSELKTHRNQAVHVFGGASEDLLENEKLSKKFGGKSVVEAAAQALELLEISTSDVTIFEELNCQITGELEKSLR
ncbi:MAG: hypothetical protein BWY32_00347 [bacterium ADurb.Bin243]|nr:MAG: hypothetical protein BWY32_00347 [bacterium ADurb.Bin243]